MNMQIDTTFPVMNAAGWCKTVEDIARLARTPIPVIIVGSYTVEERAGNPGNTFANGGDWALNSIGLKNLGLPYLEARGAEMVRIAHDAGKLIVLSIAGSSPQEYARLATLARKLGFDGVEVNGGCPNQVDGGLRKRILTFNKDGADEVLGLVQTRLRVRDADVHRPFVTFKVSVISDPYYIMQLAAIVKHHNVHAVVTCNTFPNALLYKDDGTPMIDTPDKTGWAGLSGPCIKAIALGQVNQWRKALPDPIDVWGTGAVKNGGDVHDMESAGASLVQVGMHYMLHGEKVFGEIALQL